MKPVFDLFFTTCIVPLIEAIDRHAVAVSGKGYAASAPAPTDEPPAAEAEEEAPAPAKPAKKVKADKPAAPAGVTLPAITEARLRATVKTLPDEGKMKLKAWFTEKLGANTMADIKPEDFARLHGVAVKLGATDTDPDAVADASDIGDM